MKGVSGGAQYPTVRDKDERDIYILATLIVTATDYTEDEEDIIIIIDSPS